MPKPPLPKEEFRHYPLTIKFNKAELKLLKKQMGIEKHNTIQAYIRQAIYRDFINYKKGTKNIKLQYKIVTSKNNQTMLILKENQTIRNNKIVTIADKSIKQVTKSKKKVSKYFKQLK